MTKEGYRIVEVGSPDERICEAVARLLPQLTEAAGELSPERIRDIVSWPGSRLLVAEHIGTGEIAGMLLLGFYKAISGNRAWIEDVVTDGAHRGNGIGRMLVGYAVEYSRRLGADTVMLTSNPRREAANLLYRKAGFAIKETNVYCMVLDK